MSDALDLTPGPPDSELEAAPSEAEEHLASALARPVSERAAAVSAVVRAHPWWPAAWAALGSLAEDDVEAYAYFRVGYHRGLDALRRGGWRGNGYVRWSAPANRGFLRCVEGLRAAALAIGEEDEAERGAQFLRQLDPRWPPPELAGGDG
jgi:hypothetical protein